MPTDATGTATSPDSIPTFNTSVDAPSGLGFNAAMAAIQTALSARVSKPSGLTTGDVPVWNGSTWVRPAGTASSSVFLRGDGSWSAASGGLTLIQESLLASPAATFDFTSIPSTYRSLLLEGYVRTADVAATASIGMHLNNDTTAVYDYTSMSAVDNASPADGGVFGATFGFVGNASAASAVADAYTPIVIEIPNYKSAHHKTYLARVITKGSANSAGNLDLRTAGGFWRNNSAVTRVTLYVTSGLNFATDSVVSLYGVS